MALQNLSSSTSPPNLLTIPLEIRNIIYALVLQDKMPDLHIDAAVGIKNGRMSDKNRERSIHGPSRVPCVPGATLLLVNWQTYHEVNAYKSTSKRSQQLVYKGSLTLTDEAFISPRWASIPSLRPFQQPLDSSTPGTVDVVKLDVDIGGCYPVGLSGRETCLPRALWSSPSGFSTTDGTIPPHTVWTFWEVFCRLLRWGPAMRERLRIIRPLEKSASTVIKHKKLAWQKHWAKMNKRFIYHAHGRGKSGIAIKLFVLNIVSPQNLMDRYGYGLLPEESLAEVNGSRGVRQGIINARTVAKVLVRYTEKLLSEESVKGAKDIKDLFTERLETIKVLIDGEVFWMWDVKGQRPISQSRASI